MWRSSWCRCQFARAIVCINQLGACTDELISSPTSTVISKRERHIKTSSIMASITKRELQTLPLQSKNGDVDQLLLDIQATHTKPLWAQMTRLNPPLPNPKAIPHLWDYDEIRPQLLRAGELITEKQAERRVLMLVNPTRGSSFPSLLQHLQPLPDILVLIQYR